jgi:hypothetical protein
LKLENHARPGNRAGLSVLLRIRAGEKQRARLHRSVLRAAGPSIAARPSVSARPSFADQLLLGIGSRVRATSPLLGGTPSAARSLDRIAHRIISVAQQRYAALMNEL